MELLSQPISALDAILGGIAISGGAIWTWSKMRRVLARDAVDTSAHVSMKTAMESLRDENTRLHDEVIRLRSEVNRLQTVITDLTRQIAAMNAALTSATVEDKLAREGKLERRKGRSCRDCPAAGEPEAEPA